MALLIVGVILNIIHHQELQQKINMILSMARYKQG